MKSIKCKICHSLSEFIFSKKILGKFNADYYRCTNCGFVNVSDPKWLSIAYSDAITSLDIGLVNRNLLFSNAIEEVLYNHFKFKNKFLDYAGGYGLFTRLMRDKGFDYYRQDKYCQNIFAKYFDIEDLNKNERKFELITAFEFMEHTEKPYFELDKIFSTTNNIIFSTVIVPEGDISKWWYLGTEHGQHISFFTVKSLQIIAQRYKKNYFQSGELHIFTSKKINIFDNTLSQLNIAVKVFSKLKKINRLQSKARTDFDYVRKQIVKGD